MAMRDSNEIIPYAQAKTIILALNKVDNFCEWKASEMVDGKSSNLTYMIELYRDGMVDAGFTQLSHLERLAQLRNRRRAWAHLEWKTSSVVRLRGICNAYELVGGIFAHGDTSGAEFVTTAFHSSTSPGHHQLRRENIQIHPKDFAIDPGQDLVIFIDTHEKYVRHPFGLFTTFYPSAAAPSRMSTAKCSGSMYIHYPRKKNTQKPASLFSQS
ncbi:hypothetical protein C0991_009848 [Blastosporella zonata]|nr:hypothetical protein C0991_009848 [Blastosporella zonata]